MAHAPTLRLLLPRLLAAVALLLAGLVALDTPANGDIGEGAVASVRDKQRLVAVGTEHSCAIADTGRVECWGDNSDGQLGNGTRESSTQPVTVAGLTGVTQVSAGAHHTCALRQNGTVACWGRGGNGQLGYGGTDDRLVPTDVTDLAGVTAIALGGFHSCALLGDRTVRCWGQDGTGALGDGDGGDFHTTTVAVTGLADVAAIAAGEFHTCALRTDGTVRCWGANPTGQLGDGSTTASDIPVTVIGLPDHTSRPALALTAGFGHTCVVVASPANAWCWGQNDGGQLGHPTPASGGVMQPSSTPLVVQHDADPSPFATNPQTLHGTESISAGQMHTCARVAGKAWCWGRNGHGELGADPNPLTDTWDDSTFAVSSNDVAAVVAGGYHTCAVVGSGVRCWGYNFHGQLGGYAPESAEPVTVTGIRGAQRVAAGTQFACALLDEPPAQRQPHCWGGNADGRLGSGSGVALTTVAQPVDLDDGTAGLEAADDLALGNGQACARVQGTTTLRCWGRNDDGELGDGTTNDRTTPVVGVGNVSSYDAGGALGAVEQGFTCAVRSGKAWCWGRNGNGQLGDGTTTMSSPTAVTVQYDADPDPDVVAEQDLTGVAEVATGGFHACARLTSGHVRCWGLGTSGQLGHHQFASSPLAVVVEKDTDPETADPLTGAVELTAGARHSCARLGDGTVRCWGRNLQGQLGDESTTSRSDASKPVRTDNVLAAPGSLGDAEDIAAGDTHTCAERASQGVVCWGDNAELQSAGTASSYTRAHYAVPKPNVSLPSDLVEDLAASRANTCVVYIDESVQCWGDNTSGQLGDGIGHNSLAAVPVGGLAPGVGGNHVPEPVNDTATTMPGDPVTVDVLANDTDPDGDPLTIVAVQGDIPRGTAAIVAGQVQYTPGAGCYDETFTYTVSDGTAEVTAAITVSMNCAPDAVDDTAETPEDTTADIDVLANDTDPEDDPLVVSVDAAPALGTASVNGDQTIRYQPPADHCSGAPVTFTYQVDDGHGHTDTATVTVTIDCGADAPAPGADSATTPEDTPVLIDVLANDTDADGDTLTLTAVGAAGHGSTSVSDGKVRYVPSADYCGPDTFSYTVGDGGRTSEGTVTVNVTCAGDSPRPTNDRATTDEDTAVLVDVLANDTDPDGDPLSLGALGAPAHGTVAAESGKVRYTPDADHCGPDSFGYTASDGTLTAGATVEVSVTCVNDAPVAAADTATTDEDVTVHVHVLTDDVDVDGDTLQVTAATGAAHGTLALAINDAVAYTPEPGFCGDDSFSYTVSDGQATDQGTVEVHVTCVNDPVRADAVADVATQWGDQVDVPLTATDADTGDTLAWSAVAVPAGASVVTSGQFLWTPGDHQLGDHQVRVMVSDGVAADEVVFTVSVGKRATAVGYAGATTGQVSDTAVVAALLYDAGTGLPLADEPLAFTLGPAGDTVTTGADGRATSTLAIAPPVGTKPVTAAYGGDAAYLPAEVSTPFTATREAITLRWSSSSLFLTAGDTATATFGAEIAEQPDGRFAGALGSVVVSFRDTDGALLCSSPASATGAGTARATCTATVHSGAHGVVVTASSAGYEGQADIGVVTVALDQSGHSAAAVGAGAYDAGFVARAETRRQPLAGDGVVVLPTTTGAAIVEAATLTSFASSCSGGRTKVCDGTLEATGTVREVDLATGSVGAAGPAASFTLDVRDAAEPGADADTWAVSVTGGVIGGIGSAATPVTVEVGNVRVRP